MYIAVVCCNMYLAWKWLTWFETRLFNKHQNLDMLTAIIIFLFSGCAGIEYLDVRRYRTECNMKFRRINSVQNSFKIWVA